MKTILPICILLILSAALFSQELTDSIVEISGVEVRASGIFRSENAGMKKTTIDSLVFVTKINLSLSQLLSENTSVFIKSHGRGALATASFRGTSASHTRVSWNGIPIITPMAGMVDFSLIPVYVTDELTLSHGTASLAEGSGGLGGSISIGNRPDWDTSLQLSYMQGVGSYKTYDEFFSLGAGTRKIQFRSRLYHNQSANDFSFINRGIGTVVDGQIIHPTEKNRNADYRRYGTLQELYYQPTGGQVLSVKWWSQWADRNIPRVTSHEGPDHANLSRQQDADHRMVTDWSRYTNRGKVEIRTGLSIKNLDYTLESRVDGLGIIPAIYSTSRQLSSFHYAGWAHSFSERLSVQARFDAQFHQVESVDSVTGTGYREGRSDHSILIAARYNVYERLNMQVMLRQELIAGRLSPLMPFVGFDLMLNEAFGLVWKGNLARNYRHPTMNDLYWQPGGNPLLMPEEGLSLESGLRLGEIGWRNMSLDAELTVYHSMINNWIIWLPGFKGYWEPMNISRVLSQGLEVNTGVEKTTIRGLQLRSMATYAYTRSVNFGDPLVWGDDSHGRQLPHIPVHSGNMLIYVGYRGFYASWQHHSYSERFTTSSNDISKRNWIYPYYMNDLSIGREQMVKRWQISAELKVYNVFNETYHSILYQPMPGRHFLVMMKFGMKNDKLL